MLTTINPATGNVIKNYPIMSAEDINEIIDTTQKAHLLWREVSLKERVQKLLTLKELLEHNKDNYASLITQEMGKPIAAAKAEIEKCAWVCQHYAENGPMYLQPKLVETDMQKSYVAYEALGIILAIMPWNFPFWQVFRFAIPNLLLGNAILLKHAPISTGTALAIEALLHSAGLQSNILSTLLVDVDAVDDG